MIDMQDRVREAVVGELTRQSEASDGRLKVGQEGDETLRVEGKVNLDELAMAVVGALAGGP